MNHQTDHDENKESRNPETLNSFYTELAQIYDSIAESNQPPIAKLGLFATQSLHLFEKHQEQFAAAPEAMISPFTGNHQSWLTMQTALFAKTIADAVADGKLRAIDTERSALLFLNALFGLMIRRVHLDVRESVEDDVRGLIDLFLNGLTLTRTPIPVKPVG